MGLISAIILAASLISAIFKYQKRKYQKYVLNALDAMIFGMFAALFVLFLPICIRESNPVEWSGYVKCVADAILNSMKVFIVDGDVNSITDAIKPILLGKSWSGFYFMYCSLLYIMAPVITVSYVLLLFKNVFSKLKFKFSTLRPIYIMSDLNERSIHLARDIWEHNKKAKIVFCDVFDEDVESNKGLLLKAKRIKAICLDKEITDVDVSKKKKKIEFFLIDEDESKNVNQALAIIKENKNKVNRKVFVFASGVSSAYIIDSADKGIVIETEENQQFDNNEMVDDSKSFKVRRVDEAQSFAWRTFENSDIFSRTTQCEEIIEENGEIQKEKIKVLSIMIVGFGRYGLELLKTALWFCQMNGYRLEINVIDMMPNNSDGSHEIISGLNHECPEILSTNNRRVKGDAFYDIEFFTGVNIFNDSFDKIFYYNGDDKEKLRIAQRLARTTTAFIVLGDDDKNIEAAVELRRAFERVKKIAKNDDLKIEVSGADFPGIYAAVFDELRYMNVHNDAPLRNHKEQYFNINFIGGLSEQYSYNNVYCDANEKKAYKYHVQWVDEEAKKEKWSSKKISDCKKAALENYERFEYGRNSSISRAMHIEAISKLEEFKTLGDKQPELEHCRWNAYMRSIGYIYNPVKDDRAKTHKDLVPFSILDPKQKDKDKELEKK